MKSLNQLKQDKKEEELDYIKSCNKVIISDETWSNLYELCVKSFESQVKEKYVKGKYLEINLLSTCKEVLRSNSEIDLPEIEDKDYELLNLLERKLERACVKFGYKVKNNVVIFHKYMRIKDNWLIEFAYTLGVLCIITFLATVFCFIKYGGPYSAWVSLCK